MPNDAELDPEATAILLLTGPNMSGKSTYLRQVALIALLDPFFDRDGDGVAE